jgi:hypothetical protein
MALAKMRLSHAISRFTLRRHLNDYSMIVVQRADSTQFCKHVARRRVIGVEADPPGGERIAE